MSDQSSASNAEHDAVVRRPKPPSAGHPPKRGNHLCLMWLLLVANACMGAEYQVNHLADLPDVDPGDGICATAATSCSLRAAVIEANATTVTDLIVLGPGSHQLSIAGSDDDAANSGDLDVLAPVRLLGCGPACTSINGAGADRLLEVHSGALLEITGMSLRAGRVAGAGGRGGAILVRAQSTLTLLDSEVLDNSASEGGALAILGSLNAQRVRFSANGTPSLPTTMAGGAVWVGGMSTQVRIDQCEMMGNRAQRGGAMLANGSALDIHLSRCLLTQNTAQNGGALYGEFGNTQFVLSNVTLSANSATGSGGAIFADGQVRFRLRSSTLAFNSAGQRGGAIFDVRGSLPPQWIPMSLSGVLIIGNQQTIGQQCELISSGTGPLVSTGGTVRPPDPACVMQVHASDLAVPDAGLLPLSAQGGFAKVHALAAGSAALDRMSLAECPELIDARGRRRPQLASGSGAARCDAGAFERDTPDLIGESGFE